MPPINEKANAIARLLAAARQIDPEWCDSVLMGYGGPFGKDKELRELVAAISDLRVADIHEGRPGRKGAPRECECSCRCIGDVFTEDGNVCLDCFCKISDRPYGANNILELIHQRPDEPHYAETRSIADILRIARKVDPEWFRIRTSMPLEVTFGPTITEDEQDERVLIVLALLQAVQAFRDTSSQPTNWT